MTYRSRARSLVVGALPRIGFICASVRLSQVRQAEAISLSDARDLKDG